MPGAEGRSWKLHINNFLPPNLNFEGHPIWMPFLICILPVKRNMSGYLLGIDIGTGSTKAIAVDQRGTVLFVTHIAYPTLQPLPGHSEQAPELIWQAFIKCIRNTIARLGNPV